MGDKRRFGFTLVELLIVVVILGILAAVTIPQFSDASDDAKFARLGTDLHSVRMAIARYTMEHAGRAPNLDKNGSPDNNSNKFVNRLTGRTDADGKVDAAGNFGPYLNAIPSNPFVDDAGQANKIGFGTSAPLDGKPGWYFFTDTLRFSANTAGHETL